MLIRAYHYKRNNLKATFDENDCRITRGIYHEEWNEFLVIWRNKQLEIYEDYVSFHTISLPIAAVD